MTEESIAQATERPPGRLPGGWRADEVAVFAAGSPRWLDRDVEPNEVKEVQSCKN
jgi:hypothetical protein